MFHVEPMLQGRASELADRFEAAKGHHFDFNHIKLEVKNYLKSINRWGDFCNIREGLAVTGTDRSLAWSAALRELERSGLDFPKTLGVIQSDETPANTEDAACFDHLASLAVDRKADALKVIQWVAKHMDIPADEIDEGEVPNSEAVSMLKWARSDDSYKEKFYVQMWPKTLPTRNSMEADVKVDDGRNVLDTIERALK